MLEMRGTSCVKRAAKQGLSRFVVLSRVAVIVVGVLLLAPSGCNYYGKFNLALNAIEQSGCAESIEYSRNEDTFSVEEFNFRIPVKSGCVIGCGLTMR